MREAIFPKDRQASYEAYGYSAAIKSGGFLFILGQVGVDDAGAAVTDPAFQFIQAFQNLGKVLEAADCGFDDVVDVTPFHVDMYDHFEAFAAAKNAAFPLPPFPNWTAVGVVNLADPALLLEIKVIARFTWCTAKRECRHHNRYAPTAAQSTHGRYCMEDHTDKISQTAPFSQGQSKGLFCFRHPNYRIHHFWRPVQRGCQHCLFQHARLAFGNLRLGDDHSGQHSADRGDLSRVGTVR